MLDHLEQLGNYRLTCLLGQGGFADVYLGEHIYLKTQAAIKVLQMRLGYEELEDFLNEARTVAHLVHPHIIRVLEFGVEGNTPFLVMDYAPNGTLRRRHPRDTRLPLDTITQYVKQVAAALQYAHDHKLIHRDVKPENMLLGANNDILLSDFGIALVAQSSRSHQPNVQEAAGTLAYMAPEQLQGKPRPATDQYALGIIVYEWLSGDRPFHGTFTEVASQHMFVPPAPLHEKVPTIPPAVEQVVMTALAKDPHQRFASVQLFATALEQACLSVQPHEPLLSIMTSPTNQLPQPNGGAPLPRQPLRLPTFMQGQPSSLMMPSRTKEVDPIAGQPKLSISVTPILDQPPVSLSEQPLPSTLFVPSQDPLPAATSDLASRSTLVLPIPDLPPASQPGQPFLPDTATLPLAHTSLPGTVVSSPDPSSQSTVITPPQTGKKAVSRRAVIMGLAGLASLSVVGSSIVFVVQYFHKTAHHLLPGAPATSTQAPTQTPTVQPDPTPNATPVQTPTTNPTQQPTATPVATANPTPTPTPRPTDTTLIIISSGTTTLQGTFSFDFDQGVEISSGGDVFWNQQSDTVRTLDPVGKAQLANLGGVDFNSVDLATLKSQSYSTTPLDGNNDASNVLVDNDVFAVLTNGGNHAKVLIVSYGYDLQIQWVTYQG